MIKFKYSNRPEIEFAAKSQIAFSGKFNESKHDSLKNAVIELSDNITIFGKDYNWFLQGLNNGTGQIDCAIYLDSTIYAKGYFRLEQSEINFDKRNLKIKPILSNITDAVKGWGKERKGDSFASVPINSFIGTIETMETVRTNDNMSLSEPPPPVGLGWGRATVRYERGSRGNEPVMRVFVTWARQVSVTQFDASWVFDSTISKYVSPVTTGANLVPIAGARKLKDVIRSLLNDIEAETGVNVRLKSQFFQWDEAQLQNPNEAYLYAYQYLYNLHMVQNSDAKRPQSYDRASGDAWKINLEKLVTDLKRLFNVDCKIEDDGFGRILRIEHCSYFDVAPTNILISRHNNYMIFSKIVKQKQVEQHKFEKFQYAQGVYSSEFKPFVIENDGLYLTGEKTTKLELLSCDIGAFQNVENADKLDESGFVILAVTNTNQLIYQNKSLSFGVLVEKLYKWNRIAESGKINDVATTFHQKSMISANDITLKSNVGFRVGQIIRTDFGDFEIEGREIGIYKQITRLKFG